jgi:hypothetical protein
VIRLFFIILGLVISGSSARAQWTLPQSYCFEMPKNPSDGNGIIYGELDWTDGSMTAVKLTIKEGFIKGRVFQGPYNSATFRASLEVSGDSLFGTRTVAAGTNLTLDMTDTTMAKVTLYEHLSGTVPLRRHRRRCTSISTSTTARSSMTASSPSTDARKRRLRFWHDHRISVGFFRHVHSSSFRRRSQP